MKNKSIIIAKFGMLAVMILSAYSCQKEYEMVDPPMMGYDDDLDDEIIMQEGLDEYFVTQFGEGDMDGSSWENALDAAGFRSLLSGTVNLGNSTIHMSQGKYLMSEERGLGVIIRKNVKAIKGGYSQLSEGTDLS
ncbi:MAG: right-handed parallel beta-helix repeat-containing protein, partial [Muribaculaceae bacterium]|nr:right-handed parallel beta-helix repeat-containing protein [Muribaculaceae bacterium]